nr:PREDICTED: acyl-CoA-binding domain-containing protein 5-like [Latimeria chalumnae]|eukprot:XP_005994698.1 PREDICTED: acyl-CoA-binding domain-containing protein 5-like [Latimeria chalumnae]
MEESTQCNQVTSDSESELYCDSVEQLEQEKGSQLFANQNLSFGAVDSSQFISNTVPERQMVVQMEASQGGERLRQSGSPRRKTNSGGSGSRLQHQRGMELPSGPPNQQISGSNEGEKKQPDWKQPGDLNNQIGLLLLRLQEDMRIVLLRLNTLEARTVSQTEPTDSQSAELQIPLPSTKLLHDATKSCCRHVSTTW